MNERFQNPKTKEISAEEGFTPIAGKQPFLFRCAPDVPCFNECCRDLNQFLYPYDVLRLKNNLQITSTEFLGTYVEQHIGPETGLPVLSLVPASVTDGRCPFVTPAGCRVYPDRPASCRFYPIARAITRCRETGGIREHFVLIREAHCRGFESGTTQTPEAWINHQGLDEYNRENDRMLALISRKNQMHPGPLDLAEQRLFVQSLYDLDRFREQVFGEDRLRDMNPDPADLARAETDETALLFLAHQWVQFSLFPS